MYYFTQILLKLIQKIEIFFLLSKGHALATLNLILIDKKLLSYTKLEKGHKKMIFGGQLDIFNSKFIDWNTGSLGHSLGVGIGLAIRNPKKKNLDSSWRCRV